MPVDIGFVKENGNMLIFGKVQEWLIKRDDG